MKINILKRLIMEIDNDKLNGKLSYKVKWMMSI